MHQASQLPSLMELRQVKVVAIDSIAALFRSDFNHSRKVVFEWCSQSRCRCLLLYLWGLCVFIDSDVCAVRCRASWRAPHVWPSWRLVSSASAIGLEPLLSSPTRFFGPKIHMPCHFHCLFAAKLRLRLDVEWKGTVAHKNVHCTGVRNF